MSAGLAQAEISRPQSSQDALDQAYGINALIMSDQDSMTFIDAAAVQRTEKEIIANPNMVALRILSSYLPRVSFLTKDDALLGMLYARINCRHIAMSMTEDEFEGGGGAVINATLSTIINSNYVSGIDGKLAKLLKVSPKTMEISYREDKAKKQNTE